MVFCWCCGVLGTEAKCLETRAARVETDDTLLSIRGDWEEEERGEGEEEEEGREEEEEEGGGAACLVVGGATVADVRRTGERKDQDGKAVGRRVKGVGEATNLKGCWAKGGSLAGGMERRRERDRERSKERGIGIGWKG